MVEVGEKVADALLVLEPRIDQLDTFCHWGLGFKVRVTGGARWPGLMLLSVIDAGVVT